VAPDLSAFRLSLPTAALQRAVLLKERSMKKSRKKLTLHRETIGNLRSFTRRGLAL
jgi:hypothetical protein